MSVVVTAIFRPLPGAKERLIEAMGPGIQAVHGEEGCELYAIHDAEDGTVTMIEKWTSVELLDKHGSSAEVQVLRDGIEGLLAEPAVVTRMTALPAGDADKGVL
jgi:quinol monooxygenase YgiN